MRGREERKGGEEGRSLPPLALLLQPSWPLQFRSPFSLPSRLPLTQVHTEANGPSPEDLRIFLTPPRDMSSCPYLGNAEKLRFTPEFLSTEQEKLILDWLYTCTEWTVLSNRRVQAWGKYFLFFLFS